MFKFKHVSRKLLRDYLRQLGLACVLGSITGFFLQPHHQITSLCILLIVGMTTSYCGLWGADNDA